MTPGVIVTIPNTKGTPIEEGAEKIYFPITLIHTNVIPLLINAGIPKITN